MAENSRIEWCNHTENFWIGCTEVSPACDNCYARTMAQRYGWAEWGNHPRHRTSTANWRKPLAWNARAKKLGVRHRVFTNSLSDFFDNQAPEEWRAGAWGIIDECRDLDWLILTKRPQNIAKMLPPPGLLRPWPWPNVWLGTTIENQEEADRRIPALLNTPAAVRFLSCEPLLGPVDLHKITTRWGSIHDVARGRVVHGNSPSAPPIGKIDLVIAGGESGHGARPMQPDWARSLRDQCVKAGVPFFFKQWGEYLPEDDAYDRDLKVIEAGSPPGGMYRVGKKLSGALLDGREWRQMPERADA